MKKFVLVLSLIVFWSCNQKAETETPKTKANTTVAPKSVGSDQDTHGCKASAGYTWSALRKECIRIFEVGTRLDPVDSSGMSAFVLLDESHQKAELFTLLEKKPLILPQAAPGIYALGNWQLVMHTKLAKLLYKGKVAFIQPE